MFVENTMSNLPKVLIPKFLRVDRLFCFISKCNFDSFKNPFAMVTSLSELPFRFRRFILSVQMKKENSMNYDGSSKSSWKPQRWVWLVLILIMRDIYISSNMNSLTKFTNNSRSTELKDISLYRIYPPMENLSNDNEGCPNRNENSHKLISKTGPVLSLMESQWKLRQQNDQNIPMEWKPL